MVFYPIHFTDISRSLFVVLHSWSWWRLYILCFCYHHKVAAAVFLMMYITISYHHFFFHKIKKSNRSTTTVDEVTEFRVKNCTLKLQLYWKSVVIFLILYICFVRSPKIYHQPIHLSHLNTKFYRKT